MDIANILKGIMYQRDRIFIEDVWNDDEKLSEIQAKLSVYNSLLAEHLARLHRRSTDAAGQAFKIAREKSSITEAKELSRFQSTEEREVYENASNIFDSTKDVIASIKTRLYSRGMQKKLDI